jgi:endonuclease YncB( thermonuclease family)
MLLPDGNHLKYAPGNFELERLEKEARDAKKSLWADQHPAPPWEWRRGAGLASAAR